MSGFFGVVRDSSESFDPAAFQTFAERLKFRGAGTTTIWNRPGSGLCYAAIHNVPEQTPEKLPASLNSREWMVGDIRLDGKMELTAQLGPSSQETQTNSDGEMLLRAWQKWGPDCLPKILGDYSFALWDDSKNT